MAFNNENCKEIVDNICPYCGEHLMMNKRSFANHVRWCKKNPRYEEIKNSTILKLKNTKFTRNTYKVICQVCGKEYEVICTEKEYIKQCYRKTCSNNCAHKLSVVNTDITEKNKSISSTYQTKKEVLYKICEFCGKTFEAKHKNAKYCCDKCRKNSKSKNIKFSSKYKNLCAFTFALNDFPDEFDFNLINEYGWYKAKNHGDNLNGISRDHMISKDFGFENLIDPYIISHPANCKLLQQTKNASKGSKNSLTLDELLKRIKFWHEKYGVYENKIDYSYFEIHNINLIKFDNLFLS